jgi:hypothetical protein
MESIIWIKLNLKTEFVAQNIKLISLNYLRNSNVYI